MTEGKGLGGWGRGECVRSCLWQGVWAGHENLPKGKCGVMCLVQAQEGSKRRVNVRVRRGRGLFVSVE